MKMTLSAAVTTSIITARICLAVLTGDKLKRQGAYGVNGNMGPGPEILWVRMVVIPGQE